MPLSDVFDVREAFTKLPDAKPEVVGVQIHDAEDDVMRSPQVARALGLADLSTPAARAAACAACHARGTRATAFDPTAPVHRVAPAAPARRSGP